MKVKILRYKANKILNIHKYVDSWFWNKYSAYPYKGCQFGCEFCYNREARFRPYKDPEDFSRVITIKENAAELVITSQWKGKIKFQERCWGFV